MRLPTGEALVQVVVVEPTVERTHNGEPIHLAREVRE